MKVQLFNDDCLVVMRKSPANSVDAIVTDPPAGIAFMNKGWDDFRRSRSTFVTWLTEIMTEALRVCKPGAHALVWALPRTSHWTTTALEDAGWEIRDIVTHHFGSGFPKSLDVSKAIDKAAGAKREVVGKGSSGVTRTVLNAANYPDSFGGDYDITAPATDEAKKWQGFGTALKPATEFWILARKPLDQKTVATNLTTWGTGALNIDASRIETSDRVRIMSSDGAFGLMNDDGWKPKTFNVEGHSAGRFPANLILSHADTCEDGACVPDCPVLDLNSQSGASQSTPQPRASSAESMGYGGAVRPFVTGGYDDAGGAARFFYVAKPSKKEKGADNPHPTVKSVTLMRYLCRLITPPGGTVLDLFGGTFTTGLACQAEGFNFIGIEKEKEYFEYGKRRLGR